MEWSPFWISLKVAAVSMVVTFFLGISSAFLVYRIRNRTIKAIWDAVLTLPLVLPPTVMGFFLLYLIGVKRPVGQFFLRFFSVQITFSQTACVLAAVVVSFPLMYRCARAAMEQVDRTIIEAAQTLGRNDWFILSRLLLPSAMPGIVSGGVLAFARGIGEFGATAMIAGNIAGKTRTLPMAVYSEVASGHMETAYQYVVVITILAFFLMTLMNLADGIGRQRIRRK